MTRLTITAALLLTACAPAPLTDQTYRAGKGEVAPVAASTTAEQPRAWDCPHRVEAAKHCRERTERERPAPTPPDRPEPPTKPEPEPPKEPEKPTPPEKEPPKDKPKPEKPEKPKGNPGNAKPVGNAGERPNGKGGWGDGDKGREGK